MAGLKRSTRRSSSGQHVVLARLDQEQPLQLGQPLGLLAPRGRAPGSSRCSCRRAPTRRRRRRASCADAVPWRAVLASPPSTPRGRCRGCRTSRSTASCAARRPPRRRTSSACSRPRCGFCCTPLTNVGSGSPRSFEDGRRDVDHVVELVADLATGLDARRASARSCRCACRPSARRPASSTGTACTSRAPSRRRSGCRPSASPKSSMREAMNSAVSIAAAPLRSSSSLNVPCEVALGARAVVADDVVDQRVVEDPELARARR